jgi:hypothetical protein
MNKGKIITVVIFLVVTGPIWFYLLYKILQAVKATELMWFLYWIYLPSVIVGGIIAKLSEDN